MSFDYQLLYRFSSSQCHERFNWQFAGGPWDHVLACTVGGTKTVQPFLENLSFISHFVCCSFLVNCFSMFFMAIMYTIIIYIYTPYKNNNSNHHHHHHHHNGIHILYHNFYIIPYIYIYISIHIYIYIYTIMSWKLRHAPYTLIYLGWWWDPLHGLSPRRQSLPVRRRGWPWDPGTAMGMAPRWSNHTMWGPQDS